MPCVSVALQLEWCFPLPGAPAHRALLAASRCVAGMQPASSGRFSRHGSSLPHPDGLLSAVRPSAWAITVVDVVPEDAPPSRPAAALMLSCGCLPRAAVPSAGRRLRPFGWRGALAHAAGGGAEVYGDKEYISGRGEVLLWSLLLLVTFRK